MADLKAFSSESKAFKTKAGVEAMRQVNQYLKAPTVPKKTKPVKETKASAEAGEGSRKWCVAEGLVERYWAQRLEVDRVVQNWAEVSSLTILLSIVRLSPRPRPRTLV